MNALLAGTPSARINAKLVQLETRQKQLEETLATVAKATASAHR